MGSIKTKDSKPETVLFNRIYSIYYKTAITMLEEIRTGKLKTLDDLNTYLNQFPFFRKTGNKRINTKFDSSMLLSTGADLCWNNRKFIGSAQCRRNGYILQHGSILLDYNKELLEA